MSGLVLAPDALALTIGWLKTQSELVALVGTRVMSKLPASKTWPLVRVSRIGGNETYGTASWVHDPLLQFDCFAGPGGESTSFAVARVVSALMSQRFDGQIVSGSFGAVIADRKLGGMNQGYDPVDPTIPVTRFDCQLTIRPLA